MSNKDTPSIVGGSSLVVVFAVLCLTILSVLSISTVQADGRLLKASAESIETYYMADCEAESILAQLRQGVVPDGVRQLGDYFNYQCRISDVQALDVKVRISEDDYQVLCWQVVSTIDWQSDDNLQLWNGDM